MLPQVLSHRIFVAGLLLSVNLLLSATLAQADVLTQRYTNSRTGYNTEERNLAPSNVNSKTFGKLFSREVDGEIYAQPLVVSNMLIPGQGKHNVVFVATEHNSVYAFDADDPDADRPLWHKNMGRSVPTHKLGSACGVYSDYSHEVGITGTPVIDAKDKTLYFVSRTMDLPDRKAPSLTNTPSLEISNASPTNPTISNISPNMVDSAHGFHQFLHALDITTGKERPNSPVEIHAQVPGRGAGSVNGTLAFNPRIHNQRAALLLHNGTVYISWAAHCDTGSYHGWLMGYDAKTLQQQGVFCTTPNGIGGGIWQSGGGPTIDANGNIFIVTGNGTVDTDHAKRPTEYGSSVLRLQLRQGHFEVTDFFTPYNYTTLDDADLDTGSTSVFALPGTDLVATGSKAGILYVMNRRKLGGFDSFSDEQIVQKLSVSQGFLYSTPIAWKKPDGRTWLYSWGMDDRLKAFELQGNVTNSRFQDADDFTLATGEPQPTQSVKFNVQPVSQSEPVVQAARPGGMLSLSANGNTPDTGILWALQPTSDANTSLSTGILRAFDASDLNHELWNSRLNAERDDVGLFAKFCPPVVTNGKVYVGSFSNQLCVFGLKPSQQAPSPVIVTRSGTIKDFVTLDTDIPYGQVHYTIDGSTPTSTSPRYQTPFLLDSVSIVKARTYAKGMVPSPVVTTVISNSNPQDEGTGLVGHYFASRDLSGEEQIRFDDNINNNTRPPAIPASNWSARWTGEVEAPTSGTYTFITDSDDGVRLWINDKLLIDDWNVHGTTRNQATIDLEAGKFYPIKMEYFQGENGFDFHLSWVKPGQSEELIPKSQLHASLERDSIGTGTGLEGHYFSGTDLKKADIVRVDTEVNNAPPPQGIPATQWSARWIGQVQAPRTGSYIFSTVTDDGARLWIDGKPLIDDWTIHGAKENNATVSLVKGERYTIVMEYFQGDNGLNYQLMWTPPKGTKAIIPASQLYPGVEKGEVGTGDGLLATYYTNRDLNGPSISRVESIVDTTPAPPGTPTDDWSTRWQGQVLAPLSGVYTFITNTDDGVRLWVDDKILIDDWTPHTPKENQGTITLERGRKYSIKMEYFQRDQGTTYQLLWATPGGIPTLIPQTQLYSGLDAGNVGSGQGLTGSYFDNTTFKGRPLILENQKVTVDSRPQKLSDQNWSVRWQGELQATHTGTFTITTISDDGVRLWLGEDLLIDDWNVHGDTPNKVTVDLVAGRKYPICIDYFQGVNGMRCQLLWTNPQGVTMEIPQSQLYNATPQNMARSPLNVMPYMKAGDKIPEQNGNRFPEDGLPENLP